MENIYNLFKTIYLPLFTRVLVIPQYSMVKEGKLEKKRTIQRKEKEDDLHPQAVQWRNIRCEK